LFIKNKIIYLPIRKEIVQNGGAVKKAKTHPFKAPVSGPARGAKKDLPSGHQRVLLKRYR
jgi:hypothetical protein